MTIQELREKRAKAWDTARDFLDSKRNASGLLSEEDGKTYDTMEQQIVDLGKEIDRLERQEKLAREMSAATTTPVVTTPGTHIDTPETPSTATAEYSKASNTDIFPSEKVALTDALVCLFHEFHHVKQFYDMKNGIATEEVIVSFLASQNNDDVYHDNYAYLPHELEAERNGIKNAYNYLHDNKPDLDAFQCIKEYIEFKISIGDRRYKQRGFDFSTIHSIIEIDSVFQTNIEESYNHELDMIQIHRAYSGNKIRMCNETYEINLIYKLLLELDNYESSNDKILGLLESGMPQLKFIASYVLKEHPIYADFFKKYHIPSFENYIEAYNSLIETINKEYSEKRIYMNKQDKMDKFKEYIECL